MHFVNNNETVNFDAETIFCQCASELNIAEVDLLVVFDNIKPNGPDYDAPAFMCKSKDLREPVPIYINTFKEKNPDGFVIWVGPDVLAHGASRFVWTVSHELQHLYDAINFTREFMFCSWIYGIYQYLKRATIRKEFPHELKADIFAKSMVAKFFSKKVARELIKTLKGSTLKSSADFYLSIPDDYSISLPEATIDFVCQNRPLIEPVLNEHFNGIVPGLEKTIYFKDICEQKTLYPE